MDIDFNEFFCEKLLSEQKVYSAHIVLKVMRGDFVCGKTTVKDWIRLLGHDDAYLILRAIEAHEFGQESFDGSNFEDIKECAKIILFIQNKKEPTEEEINFSIHEIMFDIKEINNKS